MGPLKLRTKIILFTACLVIAVIAGSFVVISQVVKNQVRHRLVQDLERSQRALEQSQRDRLRDMVAYSIIASENSTLKAAIDTYQTERHTGSPVLEQLRRTVENEATKLFHILQTDLLAVTGSNGEVLAIEGVPIRVSENVLNLSTRPSIQNSLSSSPRNFEEAAGIWRLQGKTYRVVSVPILLQDIVIGTLSSGYEISADLVETIKSNTSSDVVFVDDLQIIASTLSSAQNGALLNHLKLSGNEIVLNDETYLALRIPTGWSADSGFIILNSIDRAMQGITAGIKVSLVLIALFSVLVAMLLGLALSESITRPLMNFVNFIDDITRTGKLQQIFRPSRPNFEVDVLARSFESMARSLADSQAETARYHEELLRKEFNEEKLRRLATRSRLDALISQVNPHFLFNALNTVGVLIEENPDEARQLTIKLANIFRKTLQASEREVVSVEDELNFIKDYLEIEKTRFGERLQVDECISVQNAEVPCFTLQPLIENAIKHGAAPKIGTTTIRISVQESNGQLDIQVSDNGIGMTQDSLRNILERGYGLRNLVDRLNIHYPNGFSWNVESELHRGTTVSLYLPCHPSVGTA